jgi:hypothetical protein
MDVHVTVPNDLVVKASSLQAPGAPIGLGALNVTLGGDLRAQEGGRWSLQADWRRQLRSARDYDFQGRRFEILRDGTVQFVGLEEFNPLLDLRTRRVIQAWKLASTCAARSWSRRFSWPARRHSRKPISFR